jgi:hypothetical protein
MQYCVILDVEEITDAIAVGILLQRYGYKIVSAQVTPSNCPIHQEASNCEACPVVAKPATPTDRAAWSENHGQKAKGIETFGQSSCFRDI